MLSLKLQGELRTDLGKKATKAVRVSGNIPCVVYGGEEIIHFTVDAIAFNKVFITPNVYVVEIQLGKTEFKAVVKEIQFHPVTDKVLHVDFYQVFEDKAFNIQLPINIIGTSPGVMQGGKLQIKKRKLRVNGLLKDMPTSLDVNITGVNIGQSVKIPSLSYENLTLLEPKNAVVCSVNLTRAATKAANESAPVAVEEEEEATEE